MSILYGRPKLHLDHFKVAVKTPIYRCALTGAGWALAGTPAPQLEWYRRSKMWHCRTSWASTPIHQKCYFTLFHNSLCLFSGWRGFSVKIIGTIPSAEATSTKELIKGGSSSSSSSLSSTGTAWAKVSWDILSIMTTWDLEHPQSAHQWQTKSACNMYLLYTPKL